MIQWWCIVSSFQSPHKKDQLGRWLLPLLQARKCPFPSIAFAGFVMLLLFHVRFPLLSSPSAKQQQQAPLLPPSPRLVKCRRSTGGECTKVERRGPCTHTHAHSATFRCEYYIEHTADRQLGSREEGRKGCSFGAIVAVACWPMLGCSPEVQLHRNGLLLLRLLDKAPQRRMGAISYVFTYDYRSLPVSKYF